MLHLFIHSSITGHFVGPGARGTVLRAGRLAEMNRAETMALARQVRQELKERMKVINVIREMQVMGKGSSDEGDRLLGVQERGPEDFLGELTHALDFEGCGISDISL